MPRPFPTRTLTRWLSAGAFTLLAGGAVAVGAEESAGPAGMTPPAAVGRLELPVRPTRPVALQKNGPERPGDRPPFVKWSPPGRPISLGESLALGMQRAPTIKAAHASLSAGQAGYLALMNINHAAELIRPDLPIRRQQAQRGVSVGTADVIRAQQDNTYDVCRMYYTYVYATQQEQTAAEIVEQTEGFYRLARDLVESGASKDLTILTLYTLEDTIAEIARLRDTASRGRQQAYHAWKQAMGVGPETDVYPADKELPLMGGAVTAEQVVELALARRTELVLAAAAVDVTRLEACAQDRIRTTQSVPTFASGSDIHSRPIPPAVRNGEYRPGAVAPEMPVNLVGKRSDRVEKACKLAEHQQYVYEQAVGLVRLEATIAFVYWQFAADRVKEAKRRFDRGQAIMEETRKAVLVKPDPQLLVRNEALAGKAQAEYVEAVQKHLEALISLEKVTGGAVVPAFPGR